MIYKYLPGKEISDNRQPLNLAEKGIMKSNSCKMKLNKFKLEKKVQFLTVIVYNH